MFRQMMWTVFSMMERFENYWKGIRGSESVKNFGHEGYWEAEPVSIDLNGMVDHYKIGFQQFCALYKELFCESCFHQIRKTFEMGPDRFYLPTET
jgi:hypothetical protein